MWKKDDPRKSDHLAPGGKKNPACLVLGHWNSFHANKILASTRVCVYIVKTRIFLHLENSNPTLKKGKDPDSVTTRRKFGRSRLLKHSFKSNWHDPLDHHRPCAGYRLYHLIPPLSTDCAEKSQPRAYFMSAAGAVEPDCIWLGRLVQDLSWDEGTPSSW